MKKFNNFEGFLESIDGLNLSNPIDNLKYVYENYISERSWSDNLMENYSEESSEGISENITLEDLSRKIDEVINKLDGCVCCMGGKSSYNIPEAPKDDLVDESDLETV